MQITARIQFLDLPVQRLAFFGQVVKPALPRRADAGEGALEMIANALPDGEGVESLMQEAMALAARIAANPVHALRMAKRLLREGLHARLETLLEMSAAFQAIAHCTPAHDEAVRDMLDGARPRRG